MPPGAPSAPPESGPEEQPARRRKPRPAATRGLTLAADLASVGRASEWLRALAAEAGLDAEDAYRLDLCAGELLTNVVEYAYEDRTSHSIELAATAGDREDRLVRPPEVLSEARWGGWGLRLVRQFADEYRYERRGDRNVVTLVLHRRDEPQV